MERTLEIGKRPIRSRGGRVGCSALASERRQIGMAKYFGARKFEDFQIKENRRVVGTLRVKPGGLLWAPSRSRRWYRIGMDAFSTYMQEHGHRRKY